MAYFVFPEEDKSDYKGKLRFKAIRENYRTIVGGVSDTIDRSTTLTDGEQRTRSTGRPSRTQLDTVQLYLPSALNFRDAAEYTNVDLGMIGSAAAMGIRESKSGGQIMKDAGAKLIEQFSDLSEAFSAGLESQSAQVAALRATSSLAPSVNGAIETETGITLNPNRRSTFKGIGLRRFNFSFQLIPTSQKEAIAIKYIVGCFRHNLYPEATGIGTDDLTTVLKFPSKFEIEAYYGSKKVGTNILPCFLEYVNVNYNPNAMAWHSDGEPQETVVELGFIEERALTKQDIIEWHRSEKMKEFLS